MSHIKVIVLFFLIFIGLRANAQKIVIADELTSQPIKGVEVESKGFGQMTNKFGVVDITKIPLNQKLFINHLSYEPTIVLRSKLDNNDTIYLKERSNYLDSIIVTSPLRDKINVKDEPHQATEITKEDIDNEKPATSADVLQGSGQVLVQKSQGGGGSPMIRGFEANKLLMVIDGVRMNNAIYRSGHLQNAITIDPSILSGVEVIFGPSSVLYGSDALGGVMHFHTAMPELAKSTKWVTNSNVSAFFNSNDNSITSNFNYGVGQNKWGLLTSVSYSKFGDSKMGKTRIHGYDDWGLKNHYITQFEGVDSMLTNPNKSLQLTTGYSQIDALTKLFIKPSDNLDFTLNIQYSTSTNVNRYDKLNEYKDGNLKFAEWYYGPQNRFLASFKTHFVPNKKWLNAGSFIVSYQNIEEDRISRNFRSTQKDYQLEDANVFAVNLDLNKLIDSSKMLFYGLEVQQNLINSLAYSEDLMNGVRSPFQSRYPDGGSQYLSSGLYLEYKQQINTKLLFTTGIRLSYIYAKSKFLDTSFIQLPFTEINISGGAPSGNAGLIYQPDERSIFKASLASAYRSPNVDDFGKVFEKKGNTVVPTNNLKPEYALNGELSAERIFGAKTITLGASLYYTHLLNTIVQAEYSLNGQDSITYNGETTQIKTNVNAEQAQIYGVSIFFNWRLKNNLFFKGTYNFTKGINLTDNVPLSHIAPQFGKLELNYKNENINTSIYSYYNFRKNVKDYGTSSSDNLDEAIEDFGTPAWATLNYRFSYTGFDKFTLQCSATNLLDLHYRQFSSAISAPGRSFMFGVRIGL